MESLQLAAHVDVNIFGEDENKIIELRVYVNEFEDKLSSVITLDGRLGAYDLQSIFPDQKKLFTNPKPTRFLSQLTSFILEADDILLDFFAGSCTSAQVVVEMNAKDGGTRHFIIIQLPENLDDKTETAKNALNAGFETIADIGKERIRRVLAKFKEEQEQRIGDSEANLPGIVGKATELSLGFKVFKLDSSNIKPWDADVENLEEELLEGVENIKPDRSESDVLYELLLKYGLDLAVPIEQREIDGKNVFIIGAGALIVCLADNISLDTVEGIAALKDELQPELMRVVFKDTGFADDGETSRDVIKTNAVQILRQAGIEDVKSL
ncbi:MAG: hypothetical protein IID18_02275 [Nitrospinae bacterium]|nr:hypothetical protein [Nitrospinota bacterium]